MDQGLIMKGIGGFYYIKLAGDEIVECSARGKFRKLDIKPMIGDRVTISRPYADATTGGAIEEILPRKNSLVRPPVANIDQIAIVMAAASPVPDLFLIDKLLVQAHSSDIETVILINKTDISQAEEYADIYKKADYDVYLMSAKMMEGLEVVTSVFKDKITALAGNSGVGKSSILNAMGLDVQVGEVSRIKRGKHTTRHTELMPLCGGFVIDTPGFSILDIKKSEEQELSDFFPEFGQCSPCKFRGCKHICEAGCEVTEAVVRGEIASSRYESYINILKGENGR